MTDINQDIKLSIGDAAERLGISPRTIRYWEEKGLLDRPRRNGVRRVYSMDDLRKMKFIQRLKLLGLTLAEIQDLGRVYKIKRSNDQMLERLTELLTSHRQHINENIQSLLALKKDVEDYLVRIENKLKSKR